MLTLDELIKHKDQILEIMNRYNIPPCGCQLFGPIVGHQFFITADSHFLITLSKGMNSRRWDKMQDEIRELFPLKNLRFFTVGALERMSVMYEFDPKIIDDAKQNAIALENIHPSIE